MCSKRQKHWYRLLQTLFVFLLGFYIECMYSTIMSYVFTLNFMILPIQEPIARGSAAIDLKPVKALISLLGIRQTNR